MRIAECKKDWAQNNRDRVNFTNTKYRAAKKQATPPWLTECHWNEIREVYQTASDLQLLSDEPLAVDHIIPLQGENVSGLHVPWNLQILTKSENCRKYNKLIEEKQ